MIVEVIGGSVIVVSAALGIAINKYKEVKQKNAQIDALRRSLNGYAETYSFEKADEELIKKCQAKIKELFHDGIEKEFNKYQTIEERKAFAQKIVFELAKCMNVKVDKIKIEDIGLNVLGITVHKDDEVTIYLNEVLLVADPEQLVKTMCHELKHCVQYEALTNNVWNYSPQRLAQYLYSWNDYVDSDEEAYKNQIIELDAFKFADRIFNV